MFSFGREERERNGRGVVALSVGKLRLRIMLCYSGDGGRVGLGGTWRCTLRSTASMLRGKFE